MTIKREFSRIYECIQPMGGPQPAGQGVRRMTANAGKERLGLAKVHPSSAQNRVNIAVLERDCYHLPPHSPQSTLNDLSGHSMPNRSLTGPLLLILAVALLLSGCVSWRSLQPTPPSVAASRRLSRQAVAAMEVQQWDEAESLLREAVEKTPDEPEAQRYLAETLWRRGAREEALEHIDRAAALDTANPETAVQAGKMLLEVGDAGQAIQQANRSVRIDNNLADAWTLRGRAYAAQGDLDRALADLQRALLLAPNSAEVLLESARIYHQRQQHQRCLATLHRLQDATALDAAPPEVLELEAQTYLALGRPQIAAQRLALSVERGGITAERQTLQTQTARQLGVEVSSLPRRLAPPPR